MRNKNKNSFFSEETPEYKTEHDDSGFLLDLDALDNESNSISTPFDNLNFQELAEDEDGLEIISETKELQAKKAEKRKKKKKKKESVPSLKSKEDDLVFLDEFASLETQSNVQEMDLEDLIQLELSSELPEKKEENIISEEKSFFQLSWFTIIYLIITAFCLFVAHHYNKALQAAIDQYDSEQPDTYLNQLLSSFVDEESASGYFDFPDIEYSILDVPNHIEHEYFNYLFQASLTYKRISDPENGFYTYQLLANGNPVGEIILRADYKATYLNHFTTYDYFCERIKPVVSVNPATYTVTAPNTFLVSINGYDLTNAYYSGNTEALEEFASYSELTDIPYLVTYELKDLVSKPDVLIKTPYGKEVTYLEGDHHFHTGYVYDCIDFPAALLLDTNALQFIETWSNYLSGDLSGSDKGFSEVSDYLALDSSFYKIAQAYASDDTIPMLTEEHSLPEYVFCSRNITEYTPYTSTFFSCVITLQKNIVLENGECKLLEESYKCYYIRNKNPEDNTSLWKIANIEQLTYTLN